MNKLAMGAAAAALAMAALAPAAAAAPAKERGEKPGDGLVCKKVAPLGSRITQKVCRTPEEWNAESEVNIEAPRR